MSDQPLAEQTPTPLVDQSSALPPPPAQSTTSAATQSVAASVTSPVPIGEVDAEKDVAKLVPDKIIPVESLIPNTSIAVPQPLEVPAVAVEQTVAHPAQPVTRGIAPPALPQSEAPITTIPPSAAALPDIENPYILSGEVDRARLVAQTRLFKSYVEKNAKQFVGDNIKSVLDLGCGEGQLTQIFAQLYPQAQVIGIDRDEKAIESARRVAKNIPNIKFEVHDVLQSLPAGPFDLVYESIVLQHIPGTPKILKAIYDVLNPGGFLWTKDLHTNYTTAITHPAWTRLMGWLVSAADKIGMPWRIGSDLPPLLTAAGFTVLSTQTEVYPVGNMSIEGRISLSVNVGAVYNARKMIIKVLPVSESDIEQAYREVLAAMLAPDGPKGEYHYMNTIAQRPKTPAQDYSLVTPDVTC